MFRDIFQYFVLQFQKIDFQFDLINVIEILLIAGVLFYIYIKFIRKTSAEKLVKGLVILLLFWILGEFLVKVRLQILGMFFKSIVSIIILSLVVIFQPELRRFLGYLGQQGFWTKLISQNSKEIQKTDTIKELIEAVKYFCKNKVGALIVLKKDFLETPYVEVGTRIDAVISAELLITIFHPNTPLHDGAVIISGDRIHAAGVLLPLTEDPKLSWKYGTRHRAAIGLSEVSDDFCLVVSEETGEVSIAVDGILRKYDDIVSLKEDLEKILAVKKEDEEKKIIKKSFMSYLNGD